MASPVVADEKRDAEPAAAPENGIELQTKAETKAAPDAFDDKLGFELEEKGDDKLDIAVEDDEKPVPDDHTGLPPGISRFNFIMLFVGLALAVLLAALDQTIVSLAIPPIITDFQTVTGLSWIGIAYFLTSIPFIPLYGTLSDIFGRKPVFLVAIFLFELGSLVCGIANSMNVLIVGRAIAGLGGGAIFSLVLIIIADCGFPTGFIAIDLFLTNHRNSRPY